jgi:uncharacterized protein (UPF0332 family)
MEKELTENADEFLKSGKENVINKRYNAAVSDLFNCIVICCDFIIYKKRRLLPRNHTERFSLLRIVDKKLYSDVAELFKGYRDSYNLRMKKEDAERFLREAENVRARIEEDKS